MYERRHGEVLLLHLLRQPVDLALGVDVDNCLRNGEGLVQVAQRLELPLLAINANEELLDALKRQLVLLDQDPDGVAHKLVGDVKHLRRHRGREEANLDLAGEVLKDVVDLVFEAAAQHLIGFVEDEQLDVVGAQGAAIDHIKDAAGGTDDNMAALLENADVVADVGASNACVALGVHVVTESSDDLLNLLSKLTSRGKDESLAVAHLHVEALKDADGKGGGLASARLSLSNRVVVLDKGEDTALLDSRGALKTVGVDTTEQLLAKREGIERVDTLVPVGLNIGTRQSVIESRAFGSLLGSLVTKKFSNFVKLEPVRHCGRECNETGGAGGTNSHYVCGDRSVSKPKLEFSLLFTEMEKHVYPRSVAVYCIADMSTCFLKRFS